LAQRTALRDADLEQMMATVALVRQQMNETRSRVEMGLAKPGDLAEFERHLAELMSQIQHGEVELNHARVEAELRIKDAEGQLASELRRRDIEMDLMNARAMMEESVARVQRSDALLGEVNADRSRSVEQLRDLLEQTAVSGTTVLADANAVIEARDVVVLRISGETALPTSFRVGTDGAIRLPLLGDVQVRGLTAGQARDAIAERLADRRLAEGATVTVTVRRPRAGGAR
jgi:hypothetical protein